MRKRLLFWLACLTAVGCGGQTVVDVEVGGFDGQAIKFADFALFSDTTDLDGDGVEETTFSRLILLASNVETFCEDFTANSDTAPPDFTSMLVVFEAVHEGDQSPFQAGATLAVDNQTIFTEGELEVFQGGDEVLNINSDGSGSLTINQLSETSIRGTYSTTLVDEATGVAAPLEMEFDATFCPAFVGIDP